MKYLIVYLLMSYAVEAVADRDPNAVVEPKFPYFDMNNNGSYESGIDRPLNRDQINRAGGIHTPPAPDESGITPGFVLPTQVNLRGYHLIIHVDGNIVIRGNLNTRYIVGGFQVGLLQMRSNRGSITFGERITIHPDIFSIQAYGDIRFGKKSSLFQFQRGFAAPRIYRDDEDVRQFRGFQEIISENGDIVVEDYAKIDGNDQLRIAAVNGSIIGGVNSYLRSQSELELLAGNSLPLVQARISSVATTLLAPNGIVDLEGAQLTASKLQCKIGNGRVPGCVPQPPSVKIEGAEVNFHPKVIKMIPPENISVNGVSP